MTEIVRNSAAGLAPETLLSVGVPAPRRNLRRLAAVDIWDVASLVLLAALGALVVATFRDYGITNDEWVQQRYGELILDYYRSGLSDRSLFSFDNLYLYGGLFDVVATLLHKVSSLDLFDLRHLLSAACGIAGIGAAIPPAESPASVRRSPPPG